MSGRPKSKEYTPVDDEETAYLSDADSCEDLIAGQKKRAKRQSLWVPRVRCNFAGSLLVGFCAALTVLATIRGTIWYERRGSNAPRWRPAFSPMYDLIDIRQFYAYSDASPVADASDPAQIYRQPPSPAVDRAWDRISQADGVYPMSAEDVARAGKDPEFAVDAPPSWGWPEGKTKMMGIEAFHQLHCLNAVRKGLITNYHYYWGSTYGFTPPAVFSRHLTHCVDMLRQHLMCHPDLEPFTFNWREGQYKPYADFDIQKKCVDFEQLMIFAETHKDPRHTELWKGLQKPKGVLQKGRPPGIPAITPETVFTSDGVALANITGLEDVAYCLGG